MANCVNSGDNVTADPFAGLPRRHFKLIAADPPWHFKARTALKVANPGSRRDVERHYGTLSTAEIEALPVRELAAPDAHLMLWITGPMLTIGAHLPIMKAWGFKPSSLVFVWVKLKASIDTRQLRIVREFESDLHVGLGLTSRQNAEYVVLGRRGNARRISKAVRQVILSPRRQHSRKPDQFYDRAMQYADGPYLELFSRETRAGWSTWGNQSTKFDAAA